MNINVRPLKAEDIKVILQGGIIECGVKSSGNECIDKLSKEYEDGGTSITVTLDDKIMGVGGVGIFWQGVGEVWAMFSPEIAKYPIETVKRTRTALNKIIHDYNLHRVQCYVREDLTAQGFVKALGFKEEGVAKKYTHDKVDCTLYSIVR